jgi:hypothetical protein
VGCGSEVSDCFGVFGWWEFGVECCVGVVGYGG